MRDDLIARRCDCPLDEPEKPCGCGQHDVRLYRDDVWHWRDQHWTAACLITAALAVQGETAPASVSQRPAYNHTREDSRLTPCPACAAAAHVPAAEGLARLREQIAALPTREEWLGGQRTQYVQVATVLDYVDAALAAQGETAPAPGDDGARFGMSSCGCGIVTADGRVVVCEAHRIQAASPLPVAEGLDMEELARVTRVRLNFTLEHHIWGPPINDEGDSLNPEKADAIILTALRAVAEGRR